MRSPATVLPCPHCWSTSRLLFLMRRLPPPVFPADHGACFDWGSPHKRPAHPLATLDGAILRSPMRGVSASGRDCSCRDFIVFCVAPISFSRARKARGVLAGLHATPRRRRFVIRKASVGASGPFVNEGSREAGRRTCRRHRLPFHDLLLPRGYRMRWRDGVTSGYRHDSSWVLTGRQLREDGRPDWHVSQG